MTHEHANIPDEPEVAHALLSHVIERLSGNKAFIREDLMSYAGQG